MDVCKTCGNPLGSKKVCEQCLKDMFDRGLEDIDETKVRQADADAQKWLTTKGKSAPKKLFKSLELLAKMIQDYLSGNYKKIPWITVASVTFAILYVANPFDVVPDFIPGIGWLDDIVVIGLVIRSIEKDLRKYCIYKGLKPEDFGL